MLKNAYYFSYTFSSLQTSCIECSLLNLPGQKSGQLIPWDPKCAPNQTLLGNTYYDLSVTPYHKIEGEGKVS